jgi:N-acetylglucosamine-6-phosphate deacetylase
MASIIIDTHHLPAAVVTCMIRAKGPDKVIIISDAAFPGGLAPGLYKNTYADGVLELRPDGYLSVPGTTNLAGSSSSLRQCIVGAARLINLPLKVLLPMATETPANLLGRPDLGRISPGARADLVLFRENDGTLEAQTTLLAGETVFQR